MTNLKKLLVTVAAVAALASTSAQAGGFISDIIRDLGPIFPVQKENPHPRIDDFITDCWPDPRPFEIGERENILLDEKVLRRILPAH